MEFGYIQFLDNFILLFFSGSLNVAHSALHVVGHDDLDRPIKQFLKLPYSC